MWDRSRWRSSYRCWRPWRGMEFTLVSSCTKGRPTRFVHSFVIVSFQKRWSFEPHLLWVAATVLCSALNSIMFSVSHPSLSIRCRAFRYCPNNPPRASRFCSVGANPCEWRVRSWSIVPFCEYLQNQSQWTRWSLLILNEFDYIPIRDGACRIHIHNPTQIDYHSGLITQGKIWKQTTFVWRRRGRTPAFFRCWANMWRWNTPRLDSLQLDRYILIGPYIYSPLVLSLYRTCGFILQIYVCSKVRAASRHERLSIGTPKPR